ncbi:LysR family transcriptional regulator [Shewanella eurypsychrophilus]|uniref:LysR family transcriptional regulator n=1 Tax=Shewanella eurypsychrophilus TaxID=2593656 RepID=A0ABX6V3A4_9GAMM|nr:MULTISPECIES: LysR family transcriptional regulator [Shewanella]QFU21826.1 LysR family transcriptional regulator [Shewanella sp. YLB-09]QPG57116.1 LysR family transcriptional regulator [Shewanella eurypsychrophilus]
MLTLEQLYSFVETVKSGSFSAAARKLGKVQSAVSQNIMNMEIDSDQILFDRSGRYPKLTEAGQALLPQANAVVAQHRRLNQQLEALNMSQPHKLTLALDEGVPYSLLTTYLKEFTEQFPYIQLEFLNASSQDIIQIVKEKRADLGLVFSEFIYPQNIDFESVGTIEFELLVSPEHPLAKETSAHVDMLKLHRQLMIGARDKAPSNYNQQHSPDVWYADNYYVLLELAKSGFGWGLLPRHLASDAIKNKQLCSIPVKFEQLGWVANIDVIQHSGTANEACTELRKLLRKMMQAQSKRLSL